MDDAISRRLARAEQYHDEIKVLLANSPDDLDRAIELGQLAVDAVDAAYLEEADRAKMSSWYDILSGLFKTRFDTRPNEDDLRISNQHARRALEILPPKHPQRAVLCHNLARGLWEWFSLNGDEPSINEAIKLAESTVAVTSVDDSLFPDFLHSVSIKRNSRYRSFGSSEDLDTAITHLELALDIAPEDHPERPDWYDFLGVQLECRFVARGRLVDVDKAIEFSRLAVELDPRDSTYLFNLGGNLESRYNWNGDRKDLEEAIHFSTLAIDEARQDHPSFGTYKIGLGSKLVLRSETTGDGADAEEAVMLLRDGVKIVGKDNPDRFGYQATLSSALKVWYTRKRCPALLLESVEILKSLIKTAPATHPDKTAWLINLAQDSIILEASKNESPSLSEVEKDLQHEIKQLPAEHSDKGPLCSVLGALYRRRYESNPEHDIEVLKKAVYWDQEALSSVEQDSFLWATYQHNLGMHRLLIYEVQPDLTPLSAALGCLLSSASAKHASPLGRIDAIRGAIKTLVLQKEWEIAGDLASDALNLLPAVCGRYLTLDDKQHASAQTAGLAADCCSLALRAGRVETAIKQLELGRGLIWGYIMDDQVDMSKLWRDMPREAAQYKKLRRVAAQEPPATLSPVDREIFLNERQRVIISLEECIEVIRGNPTYKTFLLPPTVEEIQLLSKEGPILVVNITDISADLIIISEKELRHLSLSGLTGPTTTPQWLETYISAFAGQRGHRGDIGRDVGVETNDTDTSSLAWLWDNCVSVAFKELDSMGLFSIAKGQLLRVWWIGSGVASVLPFHAACASDNDFGRCTMARVVSSYALTIKALAYSRAQAAKFHSSCQTNKLSVLAVTMPKTPGHRSLPGAETEGQEVKLACRPVYQCKILPYPTADMVLAWIPSISIIHFACHASLDPTDAMESHLLLQKPGKGDWQEVDRLTLGAVAKLAANPDHQAKELSLCVACRPGLTGTGLKGRPDEQSWIAFLSACSTAGVAVRWLQDEPLHLAAGFQMAGFPHAVAALWSANDSACSKLAGYFYRELIATASDQGAGEAVALALHKAVLCLRREFPPSMWAPFVHFGP